MTKEVLNPNDFAPNDPKAPQSPGDAGRPSDEPLSWGEQLYEDLSEDLEISREMVASIQGDTPLKTLHQERIDYLNNLLGLTDGL